MSSSPRLRLVRLAPLALLAPLACGEALPSPTVPTTSATSAVVPAPAPLFVSDEVAHFGTSKDRVASLAVDDAGNVYLGSQTGSTSPLGTLASYDAALAKRWSVDLDFVPRGILALTDRRVLAYGAGMATKADDMVLVVIDGGVLQKQALASTLLGVACNTNASESAFVREANGGASLTVHCDKQADAWRRVRFSADLAVVASESWDGRRRFGPDGAIWFPWPDERNLGVTRAPNATANDAFRQSLGEVPSSEGSLIHRAFAIAGNGEGLVGGALVTALPAPAPWARRYATRSVVARVGAGTIWTTELGAIASTADPLRIGSIMAPPDGAVLVGFDHGEPAHVGNANLPVLGSAGDAFPEATRAVAFAELDGKTGDIRSVTSLRTKETPSWMSFPRGMVATKAYVFVQRDRIVTVHPRMGRPIASVPDVIPAAPPVLVPAVASDDASGGTLQETWSELCGPRWATKGNGPCRLEHVAVGKDGTVAAAGGYYLDNQIGTRRLPRAAYETGLLEVYERDGKPRFQRTFGVSWHNGLTEVLVRDDGMVVVAGIHGNGFSIDGKAFPSRDVAIVAGQAMDHQAYTPYVAIFDAKGKLVMAEDSDVLVHKTPSKSHARICWTHLVQGGAADAVEALMQCGTGEDPLPQDSPERGSFRVSIHGANVGDAVRVPAGGNATWSMAHDGTLFGATQGRVLGFPGGTPRSAPFSFAQQGVLVDADAVWAVGEAREGTAKEPIDALVVSKIARDLSRVDSRVLASAKGVRIDGVTIDDAGRPLVSVRYEAAFTIAGKSIPAPPTVEGVARGRLLVRMTKDGSKVERVLVVQGKPNGCAQPGFADLTDLQARSGLIAMTYRFGVSAKCKIGDESSTVMTFAAPP